jgi:hypothetical protein
MSQELGPVGLASATAERDRTTLDPMTEQQLMAQLQRLLVQAGLPRDEDGGDESPGNLVPDQT